MITAAAASSLLVLRIRPTGLASLSPGSPSTCVVTATPVSKPESPSASLGKTRNASATMARGLPFSRVSVSVQWLMTVGFSTTCQSEAAMTTRLRTR